MNNLKFITDDKIFQIQSRYQGGEPWYQNRRSIQRPESKPVVNDKIDPPFSKTQSNKE